MLFNSDKIDGTGAKTLRYRCDNKTQINHKLNAFAIKTKPCAIVLQISLRKIILFHTYQQVIKSVCVCVCVCAMCMLSLRFFHKRNSPCFIVFFYFCCIFVTFTNSIPILYLYRSLKHFSYEFFEL